jgi:phosphoribosylformylglycinamidine synthase
MGDACRVLGTPVTGGNVSFYNESPETAVFPTPVIGMVGLLEDASRAIQSSFRSPGDAMVLLGTNRGHMGGSEYALMLTGKVMGDAPELNMEFEKRLQKLVLGLIRESLVRSAHDTSEGGLAVCLAESCFGEYQTLGAEIKLSSNIARRDFLYFGEDQSRIVISVNAKDLPVVFSRAKEAGIPAMQIGEVTAEPVLRLDGTAIDMERARTIYERAIPAAMGEA